MSVSLLLKKSREELTVPQLLYASQMVYPTAIMTAKLSILSLYWRLFPTRFMKRGCVVLGILTLM